jgi:hypothetical protein
MRTPTIALLLAMSGLLTSSLPATARGGHHGRFGSHGMHGHDGGMRNGALAGDRKHANDDYVKAASQEEDRLLDTKIKSICRGC